MCWFGPIFRERNTHIIFDSLIDFDGVEAGPHVHGSNPFLASNPRTGVLMDEFCATLRGCLGEGAEQQRSKNKPGENGHDGKREQGR